jgi:hypothetical protein
LSDGIIDPIANPDTPPWTQYGGVLPASTTKVDLTGLLGGSAYYVAVSYIVSGITGDRRVLGPQTVPATDVSGAVNPLIDAALGKLAWKQPVRAKTTAALAANTYANGASGVGATLTATANGGLAAQDGVTLVVNDRLIVDHEATASHNGIYKVTQLGDGSHPYILTRATDADEAAELINAAAKVEEGTTFADQEWQCTTNAAIVVGTTALVFAIASVTSSSSGQLIGLQIITATGSGTYTPTSGTNSVVVELIGGGGQGGAIASPGASKAAVGAGGSGGGYLLKRLTANFSGGTYSVGVGGSTSVAGANTGQDGGNTTFTTTGGSPTTYTAKGGLGGFGQGGLTPPGYSASIVGQSTTGGDLNMNGGPSRNGIILSAALQIGGGGGPSGFALDSGAAAVDVNTPNVTTAGANAVNYGGGGGGAAGNGTGAARAGGVGGNGAIIIREYS